LLKALHILFSVLLLSVETHAQKDSLLKTALVNSVVGDIVDFTTDNLGNIYVISSTNQLKKLNEKGDSISVVNDIRRFGKISAVDASNPLKVLVYYKDFSRLVILDRLLNIRNTIDLRQQNIFQVKAFTISYDNNIWLYDELDSKIKKLDDNGKVLVQTIDFRQLFDEAPSPTLMFDRDGLLFLYDSEKGLSSFDYYGALKNNLQLKNIQDLQVLDKNTITGRDSSHIILYKTATLQTYTYRLSSPLGNYKKIRFTGTKLYALTKNGQLKIFTTL
jgi:hypothetical protein